MKYGTLKKQSTKAFGNTIFLLGKDAGGVKYWLEAPIYNKNWGWSFGHIYTYTWNNSPQNSHDIASLERAKDFYPYWVIDKNARLRETVFNRDEAIKLAELFKDFYILRDFAHLNTTNSIVYSDNLMELNKIVNYELIPRILDAIIKIIKPKHHIFHSTINLATIAEL